MNPEAMTDDEREAWIEEARIAMVIETDAARRREKLDEWMYRHATRSAAQIARMEQAWMARIEAGL